jgi:hypothetical protein
MKYLLFSFVQFCSIVCFGQNQKVYSGTVTEKVEISISNGSMKFTEDYDPPVTYKLILRPGIVIWSFKGNSTTFTAVKPAYRDQNGTLVFPVKDPKDNHLWVFMITRDGDQLWMEMVVEEQVMRGYYLR